MRGLEITIFLLCILIGLPAVSLLLPVYNGGAGIPMGANDVSGINAFNWSKLDSYKPNQTAPSLLDQASYIWNFVWLAITGFATILFAALWAAPALLSIIGISGPLMVILLSVFAIVIIIAWLQIIKGDDWSGKR
jgi:hypothetical protein